MEATLIQNGLLYDGTLENPPVTGDLLIRGDRIAAMGPHIDCPDAQVIDACGRAVTPGFIDVHRHADLAVFFDDFGSVELSQGLTTIGMGVCGFSFAPYTKKSQGLYPYVLSTHGPSADNARYVSMSSYLEALRTAPRAVNVSTLQGLGAIRLAVKGYDPSPFTKKELDTARGYVQEAIDCGLRGMSTGLVYLPEVYTSTEELEAILAPCKGRDLLYMPHMRDEASRLAEAVEESIRIARSAGMALGISHFKALGPDNWHETLERAIEKIEQARADGMDVSVDFYPYHGTATTLASILPASFLTEDFGRILANITTPESIDRLRRCYRTPGPKDEIMDLAFRWSHAMISGVTQPENQRYLGKTVHECAQMAGYEDEYPFIANLLASENGSVGMVGLNISPEDINRIAKLPYSMVISDSLYNHTDTPHPRIYASFPHILRHYVGETHVLTMQQAIHKMTQLPAQRMRYRHRGTLAVGNYADVLVFDPARIGDNATFDHGKRLSTGMDLVFVNGQLAWKDETRLCRAGVLLH
ncbi:N-acyl-D-amino-acid deacylase family protein [Dysosmobacter sp.]